MNFKCILIYAMDLKTIITIYIIGVLAQKKMLWEHHCFSDIPKNITQTIITIKRCDIRLKIKAFLGEPLIWAQTYLCLFKTFNIFYVAYLIKNSLLFLSPSLMVSDFKKITGRHIIDKQVKNLNQSLSWMDLVCNTILVVGWL